MYINLTDNWGVVFGANVGNAVEERGVLVVVFCEDDIDEREEVEKKVEDEDEDVIDEDVRNGMTMAGFEETDGLDMGVGGAATEVAFTGADVGAWRDHMK